MRLSEKQALGLMYSALCQFFLLVWEIIRFALILAFVAWVIFFSLLSIPALLDPFGFITLIGLVCIVLGFAVAWLFADMLHSFQWRKLAVFIFGGTIWQFVAVLFALGGGEIDRCYDWGGYWENGTCVGSELWDEVEARKAAE